MHEAAPAAAPPVVEALQAWKCYLSFFRDQVGTLAKLRERYGSMVVLRDGLPGRRQVQGVIVSGAQPNRQVLTDLETFQSGGTMIRGPSGSAQNRLRKGLVAINGEDHREKRRLVSPMFLPKATQQYFPKMAEVVRGQLDTWPIGQPVDVAACVSRTSLLVSAQNLLAGEDTHEAIRLAEMADEALRCAFLPGVWLFPFNLAGTPYRRLLKRAERLERELLNVIARRAEVPRDSHHLFDRLIGTHLAEPDRMSREDLIGQMMFTFSASHETVAKGVVWSLFLLAQHPRIMAELHEELRSHCGQGPPTLEVLERMPLLDAVTNESMRLLPPVPWMARRVRAEADLAGLTVRPKDYVVVSIYGTHRDPDVFPEPLAFRPERWFDSVPDSYAYLPFGAGPRTCVAKSLGSTTIKTMVAMILGRFRLTLVPGSRIDRIVNVTLAPKHGLPMVVEPQDGQFRAEGVHGNIHEMVDLSRADATTGKRSIRIQSGRHAAGPMRHAA